MEQTRKQEIGICYECMTKNNDSSKKIVYRCDVCGKWFCELHEKPKLPYFVDWETQFDVQGNPAIKAMFFSEYGRQDGHPDFIYLGDLIEKLALEEKKRNELIKQAIDKMMENQGQIVKSSAKIPPTYTNEEATIWALEQSNNLSHEEAEQRREKNRRASATRTYANEFKHDFPIPAGIYSIDKYYDRLNKARTLAEVNEIIEGYKNSILKEKKHWWQKS